MRLIFSVGLVALTGCGNAGQPTSLGDPVQDVEIASLKQRVDRLESRADDSDKVTPTSITLEPSDNGTWLATQTSVGRLAFIFENIEARGAGSRVTLQVGNPTTATITKIKALVSAGPDAKQGASDLFFHSWNTEIPPGTWRTIHVDVSKTPPAKLAFVRLTGADVESLRLSAAD